MFTLQRLAVTKIKNIIIM